MNIANRALCLFLLLMLSSCASDRYRYAVFTPKDGKIWTENESRQTCQQLGHALTSKGFIYLGSLEDLGSNHHRNQIRYGRPVSAIHYRTKAVSRKSEWQDVEKRGGIGVSFESTLKKIVVSQSVAGPGYHEETLNVVRLVEKTLIQHLGLGAYKLSLETEGLFVFDPT